MPNIATPLPRINPRAVDRRTEKIWDGRLRDRLDDLEDSDFFKQPPPDALQANKVALSLFGTDKQAYLLSFHDACEEWWKVNDVIFREMEQSLILDGAHFDRDHDKIQSFKTKGTKDAFSLFHWIESFYDDTTEEVQQQLLRRRISIGPKSCTCKFCDSWYCQGDPCLVKTESVDLSKLSTAGCKYIHTAREFLKANPDAKIKGKRFGVTFRDTPTRPNKNNASTLDVIEKVLPKTQVEPESAPEADASNEKQVSKMDETWKEMHKGLFMINVDAPDLNGQAENAGTTDFTPLMWFTATAADASWCLPALPFSREGAHAFRELCDDEGLTLNYHGRGELGALKAKSTAAAEMRRLNEWATAEMRRTNVPVSPNPIPQRIATYLGMVRVSDPTAPVAIGT